MSQLQNMIRRNEALLNYITRLFQSENNEAIIRDVCCPKQIILEQRRNVYNAYIISSGIAKCYQTEDTGKDFIQEFFGAGEIFGEIELFNQDISFCSIEAITELIIYKIPKDYFKLLIEKDKVFNRLILTTLAAKIKDAALRHSYNQSHPIKNNLLRLQEQFPDLIEIISKKDIANYLGITERSLNRTLSELKK